MSRALTVLMSSALLAAFLARPLPVLAEDSADDALSTVIVISVDGVRHDYPDMDSWPAITRIIEQGVRADRLIPVYPSDTLPTNVTIATGTYPDKHGIVGNSFYDHKRGLYAPEADENWLMAEPLWATAERQGVIAAVYFWIGSETPWRGNVATYRKHPINVKRKEKVKVNQILDWLDLPLKKRPRLIMSHWPGVDALAHMKGPNHPEVAKQIRRQDAQLERLMRGLDERKLWKQTTLIVVSDHGMTEVNKFIFVHKLLTKNGVQARVTGSAALQNIYLEDKADQGKAFALLQQEANSTGQMEVRKQSQMSPAWRLFYKDRTGDFIVTTSPPYSLIAPTPVQRAGHALMQKARGWRLGMHGYDPMHPDMGGIFLAFGRGAPAGMKIKGAHQIDIAPTVAALLGIEPPLQAEGRVLLPASQ